MTDAATLVREFHVAMGAPVADKLQKLCLAAARLRMSLILEEVGELAEALGSDGTVTGGIEDARAMLERDKFDSPSSIVEAADALADIEYVTAGTAVEMGIPLGLVLSEVHRSNMTKKGAARRADGKILKSASYEPPRIAEVLGLAPPFEYPAPCEGGLARCDVSVSVAPFLDPKGRGEINAKLATVDVGDPVAWPSHYMAGQYECREVVAALGLNFTRGSAFKYLWRAGRKEGADELQDLRKARACLDHEIGRVERRGR